MEEPIKVELYRVVKTLNSEEEIEANADMLNAGEWRIVSRLVPQLSFEFVRKFSDQLHWDTISRLLILSFEFIKEFKDKLNLIAAFQNYLADKEHVFDYDIDEFLEIEPKVLSTILLNTKCSEKFLEKYMPRFEPNHWYIIHKKIFNFSKEFQDKYSDLIKEKTAEFIRIREEEEIQKLLNIFDENDNPVEYGN